MFREDIKLTCLGSDCPERFSLCCGKPCRNANEPEMFLGVPEFYCFGCGKEFEGGKCRGERIIKKPPLTGGEKG